MSTRKQDKAVQNFQQVWQRSKANSQEQMQWLLRSLLVSGRQANIAGAGFVLPTVAMVSLVVVLLTTALMIRSFDRSRSASNFRVDETVLNAATPALDRARAKINALLVDLTLPQETPTDAALEEAFNRNSYILGDETRLKLVNDIDRDGTIGTNETLTTAWRFPVDTDNNGKFDTYTLYGVYFRSPIRSADRTRNTLAARTSPMEGGLGSQCENAAGSSTSLIGDSGWYKSGAKLTKSFFVYTATVPITTTPVGDVTNYEVYKGNKGFSALEFQQDRDRIPLSNNIAAFQDDLELTSDSRFRLNGRISTNGNLLIGSRNSEPIRLFQVSGKNSCFYTEDNSKITVGGNVGIGSVADTSDQSPVIIDLFNGFGNDPITGTIERSSKSTTSEGGFQVGYNDAAYNQRIALMKQTALSYHPDYIRSRNTISNEPQPTVESVSNVDRYPQEVKEGFADKLNALKDSGLNAWDVLAEQIEIYLKTRTRRVPYAEVPAPDGTGAVVGYTSTNVFEPNTIEPIAAWREPTDVNTKLSLYPNNLPQTQPEKQQKDGKETYLGDRIYVGNNLPAYWKNGDTYVTGATEKQLLDNSISWTEPKTAPRYRTTQVTPLPDARISDRNGFWENAAAQQPATKLSNTGGLRVITGAGIYRDPSSTPSFMAAPTTLDSGETPGNAPLLAGESIPTPYTLVLPDTMPMKGGINPATGTEITAPPDLRMRATAVYHYKDNAGTSQTPIACVSSYYDPTNATTAKNKVNVDGGYGVDTSDGRSNNGVVYPAPYTSDTGRFSAIATYLSELKAQAKLKFPSDRIVNEPLQQALQKLNPSGGLADTNKPLSLSENSAIDTAICAIKILTDSSFTPSTNPIIPHGAIKEASFLDARQVKAIDKTATNYDLELEQRQPLEIRVTEINLDIDPTKGLTRKTISRTNEYLLPNSGIIYASRDDALLDLSDATTLNEKELLSPTDFKLDSTRRPNGIRLINGKSLARTPDNNFREEEKGLILATNLPAYIKGDFNLHQQPGTNTVIEEFIEKLRLDWSNFYTRNSTLDNIDNSFACRKEQPGCGDNGDQWRPATIISDAITVLSEDFKDGFRDQGDYDLRNNAGSSVTQDRKKNGFFDNSFVTSAAYWDINDNNGFPTNTSKNSYLTNGVTPIQRRTNFPEYVMEICRKLPVSECKPSDWVVGYDDSGNGRLENSEENKKAVELQPLAEANKLGAGTTARPALNVEDRRYARRVAFDRKDSGGLVLTDLNGQFTPIPLGINNQGKFAKYAYSTSTTAVPNSVDNALWFRTTNNTSGRPFCSGNNNPAGCTTDDRSYAKNKPLYYDVNTRLISPRTPDIPNVSTLNEPEANPPSGYTVCTKTARSSKKYSIDKTTRLELGNCNTEPGNPLNAINDTLDDLLNNLNPSSSVTDNIVFAEIDGTLASGEVTTFADNPPASPQSGYVVNVIDLNPHNQIGTSDTQPTTIRLEGDENSVFVFRKSSGSLNFGANSSCSNPCNRKGVVVELVGVDPNNIFWALDANVQWNEVSPDSFHDMKGTFIIGGTATPSLKNVKIEGRLLGVNNLPAPANFSDDTTITAITSNEQPSLVPVLQIHSPEGSPSSNLERSGDIKDEWLQQVRQDTIVNAVFVSGNSPSRRDEESAGLQNFVRLLENWDRKILNIKGSFIQLRRSAFATGPFATILSSTATTPDPTNNLSLFDYPFNTYRTDNGTPPGTLPYYNEPNRQWSFDVGLLSQSPDLFAQKFTQQPVNPADEFFREVSRDDEWIETLLCAAQGSENNYTYAIDASERPNNCPALTAYNDSPLDSNLGEQP